MAIKATTTFELIEIVYDGGQKVTQNKSDQADEINNLIYKYNQKADGAIENLAAREALHYYCTPKHLEMLKKYYNDMSNYNITKEVADDIDILRIKITSPSTAIAETKEVLIRYYENGEIKRENYYKTYYFVKDENRWYINRTKNSLIL